MIAHEVNYKSNKINWAPFNDNGRLPNISLYSTSSNTMQLKDILNLIFSLAESKKQTFLRFKRIIRLSIK